MASHPEWRGQTKRQTLTLNITINTFVIWVLEPKTVIGLGQEAKPDTKRRTRHFELLHPRAVIDVALPRAADCSSIIKSRQHAIVYPLRTTSVKYSFTSSIHTLLYLQRHIASKHTKSGLSSSLVTLCSICFDLFLARVPRPSFLCAQSIHRNTLLSTFFARISSQCKSSSLMFRLS